MPDGRDGRVVLIVQEELVIRMDVVEAFETGGFKIFQADMAEKAIDALQSEPTIRVVFTDVDLPGTMDGLTLAHYVRHRWPPTILLVGSGRTVLDRGALPSKARYVRKPYGSGNLAEAVLGALSQIGAAA
jgi:two-component system, response regulator PdtaR